MLYFQAYSKTASAGRSRPKIDRPSSTIATSSSSSSEVFSLSSFCASPVHLAYAGAFVSGLCASNQHTSVFYVAPVVLAVLYLIRKTWKGVLCLLVEPFDLGCLRCFLLRWCRCEHLNATRVGVVHTSLLSCRFAVRSGSATETNRLSTAGHATVSISTYNRLFPTAWQLVHPCA